MKQLRILICCESSGTVREAFRALGHDAWSCDLLPADDGSPYHIQGEALDVVTHSGFLFDMIGLHPPCTYLGVSGIHWNDRGRGWEKTHEALQFVKDLIAAAEDQPFYLENPVSIISSKIRKPDQIIQPYQFGDDASKKNLPLVAGLATFAPRPCGTLSGARGGVQWQERRTLGEPDRLGAEPSRSFRGQVEGPQQDLPWHRRSDGRAVVRLARGSVNS